MKTESEMCTFCRTDADGYSRYLPKRFGSVGVYIHRSFVPEEYYLHGGTLKHPINTIINFCPMCGRKLKDDQDSQES